MGAHEMPRQVKCPRCSTINTVADGAKPICANCGFGSPGGAPPAARPPYQGMPPGGMPAYGAPPGFQQPQPKGMAVTAMVLGIVGCCIWIVPVIGLFISVGAGIAAIIVAVLAMKKIKLGQQGGKGMAITGLVLGIITVVMGLLILLALFAFVSWLEPLCEQQPDHEFCKEYEPVNTFADAGAPLVPKAVAAMAAAFPVPRWFLPHVA